MIRTSFRFLGSLFDAYCGDGLLAHATPQNDARPNRKWRSVPAWKIFLIRENLTLFSLYEPKFDVLIEAVTVGEETLTSLHSIAPVVSYSAAEISTILAANRFPPPSFAGDDNVDYIEAGPEPSPGYFGHTAISACLARNEHIPEYCTFLHFRNRIFDHQICWKQNANVLCSLLIHYIY